MFCVFMVVAFFILLLCSCVCMCLGSLHTIVRVMCFSILLNEFISENENAQFVS